jgi:hypothetical protein
MTDRFYALTVVLERDIREDDAERLIDAIRMLKNVVDVKGNVSDPTSWMAVSRARHEFIAEILNVLKDDK